MSGLENTKKAVEALENKDYKTLESLLTEDFLFYSPLPTPLGRRGFIEVQRAFMKAVPDFKLNAADFKEIDGKITCTIQITGTPVDDLHLEQIGLSLTAPTGKWLSLPQGTIIVTLRGGAASRIDLPMILDIVSEGADSS